MDIDKVSLLKLRANIGTTGNQNVGLFSSNDIYNFIPNNNSFGTGLELTQLGNENLAWQQTLVWESTLRCLQVNCLDILMPIIKKQIH